MMNKTVLYISYDGMTDPLGQSQVLPYISGLVKKGYQFHLISFEKEEKFKKFQTTIKDICDRANIHWHPQSYTKKPPLLSTLYDVWRMFSVSSGIIKKYDVKVVHCRSYIAALAGIHFKRKLGVKFIFDMRGFWADERVEGNIWNLKNPIFSTVYQYFKKKEIEYFNEADYVISLTYNGEKEIHSWKTIQNNPIQIQVIPCCVDIQKFSSPSGKAATKEIEQLKKEGKFVLGYIGSIGTWYLLEEMLDFYIVFKKKYENAIFLFVTQEQELVKIKCKENGISLSQIFLTSCLHAEVPDFINLFDVSIFFIKPSFSKKASSPTKQGEIMALGKPIFCNSGVGDTDLVIKKYHAGEIIEDMNEASYTQAIEKYSVTSYAKEEIIKGANEFYSLEEGVKRYEKVYMEILNGSIS